MPRMLSIMHAADGSTAADKAVKSLAGKDE
jgi:hypothetical protein